MADQPRALAALRSYSDLVQCLRARRDELDISNETIDELAGLTEGHFLDARAYMLRLSKDRERSARWQRAAQLLLAKADVGAVSRQLELALLYDGKLDVRAMA
jgi:hypothetical protein